MIGAHTMTQAAAVETLRTLAKSGSLAQTARTASIKDRAVLSGAAFAVAWPIVFHRLTRVCEQRRGHWSCASGLQRLADECLDRFYDDVEAVVEDLLAHAATRIQNLEGWITARLRAATVDAHRRRRGARGALQRPRLPGWLAAELGNDPWLSELAVEILQWVGVPTTAGTQLWPLDEWADRRLLAMGESARPLQQDIHQVLQAMRRRPKWYADYIERPLGAKVPPLVRRHLGWGTTADEMPALILTQDYEVDDSHLAELATITLHAIEAQLRADPTDEKAIAQIIVMAFGQLDIASESNKPPWVVAGNRDRVDALIEDPEALSRVVSVVRDILAG